MATILIIDDDPDARELCRIPLEQTGFDVREACTPEEGISKAVSEHPDLVILDVLMPSAYEGFEVARTLREEHNMHKLPILMLSAVHDVKQVPYRFAPDATWLPVDVFLDKPVSPKTLVNKVRELLGTRREEPDKPL